MYREPQRVKNLGGDTTNLKTATVIRFPRQPFNNELIQLVKETQRSCKTHRANETEKKHDSSVSDGSS
jgi:hypothetical protein